MPAITGVEVQCNTNRRRRPRSPQQCRTTSSSWTWSNAWMPRWQA